MTKVMEELESDERGAVSQLAFIESMILEGRRTTEYWGWCFLLWGTAYLVAVAWGSGYLGKAGTQWAWPVSMVLATVLTVVVAARKSRGKPVTTQTRAIQGIWTGVGLGIFIFAFPATFAGRYGDGHLFTAGIEILLGVAHFASGSLLRWRLQLAVGGLWWVAALVSTLTHNRTGLAVPFVTATLVCNMGFGAYLMYAEARDKARLRLQQVAHA